MFGPVRHALHWWRQLPQNPVYQREKGRWGNPNPFYSTLSRYSVLLIFGTILLGGCTGFSSPFLFGNNEALTAAYCFLCLPGVLVNVVALYALFTAPALTAPLISTERDQGTWDTLRATPQSTRSIVLAKLFGALSRQRIWPILLGLSALQGAILACSFSLLGGQFGPLGLVMGAAAATRPLLEVFAAALLGLTASLSLRSATSALVFSYTAVIALKLFNSSAAWNVATGWLLSSGPTLYLSAAAPVLVYLLLIAALLLAMRRRLTAEARG